MAQLISKLITWGLILLSLGTISEVTYSLAKGAAQEQIISLTKLNKALNGPKK